MKCEEMEELINDYFNFELSKKDMKIVEDHILKCKKCAKIFYDLEKYKNEMVKLSKYKLKSNFLNNLNHVIDKQEKNSVNKNAKIKII